MSLGALLWGQQGASSLSWARWFARWRFPMVCTAPLPTDWTWSEPDVSAIWPFGSVHWWFETDPPCPWNPQLGRCFEVERSDVKRWHFLKQPGVQKVHSGCYADGVYWCEPEPLQAGLHTTLWCQPLLDNKHIFAAPWCQQSHGASWILFVPRKISHTNTVSRKHLEQNASAACWRGHVWGIIGNRGVVFVPPWRFPGWWWFHPIELGFGSDWPRLDLTDDSDLNQSHSHNHFSNHCHYQCQISDIRYQIDSLILIDSE